MKNKLYKVVLIDNSSRFRRYVIATSEEKAKEKAKKNYPYMSILLVHNMAEFIK